MLNRVEVHELQLWRWEARRVFEMGTQTLFREINIFRNYTTVRAMGSLVYKLGSRYTDGDTF